MTFVGDYGLEKVMVWKNFENSWKIEFKRFLPYFDGRWPPENLFFQKFLIFLVFFTYWHERFQVLQWLGVRSISNSVWKMSIFQIPLTLIRLGFLKVVFPGGGGQFDLPPSYFEKNLTNFNKTLYNC